MADYTDIIQQWTILTSQAAAANDYTPPTDFSNVLPFAITYAEQRIFKDIPMLAQRTQDSSLVFSGNTRTLDLSQMTTPIVVPEGLAMITPAGSLPNQGNSIPFTWTTLDVIDQMWPDQRVTVDPATRTREWYWTLLDATTIAVAPIPNAAFVANVTGLFQPTPLSAANPITYLSATYTMLYVAAGMIYNVGYMRNYGAMADNAKMGLSWESQYDTLKEDALLEEQRRRGAGTGWSQNMPTPIATPQRTG